MSPVLVTVKYSPASLPPGLPCVTFSMCHRCSNTWVAIRALEQLVPVLAHHHQVGHPDVAHLGQKKLDMYPNKLSVCQVNVVWFKLFLRLNLSVGLSAVRILVSRSSQEQVVAFWVHRHSPHLVVDVPWKDRSWCPSAENHIRFENPESWADSPCIEAPWLPIGPPPELLLGCTVHLGNE